MLTIKNKYRIYSKLKGKLHNIHKEQKINLQLDTCRCKKNRINNNNNDRNNKNQLYAFSVRKHELLR